MIAHKPLVCVSENINTLTHTAEICFIYLFIFLCVLFFAATSVAAAASLLSFLSLMAFILFLLVHFFIH